MGQKVNPVGIRLGITRDWVSKWYAGKKQFPAHVHTDFRVREFLKKKLAEASVSRVQIERAAKRVNITIQTVAASPIAACATSLMRAETPLWLRRESLR